MKIQSYKEKREANNCEIGIGDEKIVCSKDKCMGLYEMEQENIALRNFY